MGGLGTALLSNIPQLAMMAYSMYQKNKDLKSTSDMQDINAEIDGGKEGDNDEVTQDNKIDPGANFLAPADKNTKPKGLFGFSSSTYF